MFCPACTHKIAIEKQNFCDHCGYSFNVQQKPVSIINNIQRPPKMQLDIELGITIDRTGSSSLFQTGIPLTLEMILNQISIKATNPKCWLQSHGDLDFNENPILHSDGSLPEQVMEDVKKIVYAGGGDPQETHLDALENLINIIPWTLDPIKARGAIIAFMTDETKYPTKSGLTAKDISTIIKEHNLLLYFVCQPKPYLCELINLCGGMMLEITNSPDPSTLQVIAGQLSSSIVLSIQNKSSVPIL